MKLRLIGMAAFLGCAAASQGQTWFINEVDPDTPGSDALEFVEIKGPAHTSLLGKVLVIYGTGTGGNRVKFSLDLTGSTDANGYYLVGNPNVAGEDQQFPAGTLEQDENAVALFTGSAATFVVNTTAPSGGASLLSYVVYESNLTAVNDTDRVWTGFTGGTAPPVYDENIYQMADERSVSLLPNGTGNVYDAAQASPRAANVPLPDRWPVLSRTSMDWGQFNAVTTLTEAPTTVTFTLTNKGKIAMDVTTFGLDAATSSVFTVTAGPDPALGTLAVDTATSIVVQFANADTSSNKLFGGAVNVVTNSTSHGSLTAPLKAAFVNVSETPTSGTVLINEISYAPNMDWNQDGFQVDQDDEFVEIYNTTAAPISIEGWEINILGAGVNDHNSYVFPAGATIAANGFVVMFAGGSPLSAFAPGTAFDYQGGSHIYNPGSAIALRAGSVQIDAVAYLGQSTRPGYTPIAVSESGGSIGRRPDGSSAFMAFPDNGALVNRPSPAASNNLVAAAADWAIFE